jgi:hypothetical protein
MGPKTPPSTPVSESVFEPGCVTEWKPIGVSASEIDLDVRGFKNANNRSRWLQHAAVVIRSGHLEIGQAYRDHARWNGLHEALDRAILVLDISVSLLL